MSGYNAQFVVVAGILAVLGAKGFNYVAHSAAPAHKTAAPSAAPKAAPAQIQAAAAPAPARAAYGEEHLSPDRAGQFSSDVDINGTRIHMLVDTGASSVALSYEDAAAIGVFPAPSDYKYQVSTANGIGRVAKVRLKRVQLGFLAVDDVEALVGERGALSTSLLGMTYLSKLHVEMGSSGLTLRY